MRVSKLPQALLALFLSHHAMAADTTLPTGGTVVGGSATISQNGNTQTVTQTSGKAIINWQDFSIGKDGTVNFVQPNSSSVVLNRVLGGNRSEIYGKLTANGQVFIVNPNGIYFGSGSSVDVGGLLATTLSIGDDDFMNSNYVFLRASLSAARRDVINDGVLKARDNGYVILAGDYAANRGIVQAKLGTVALASGSKMTMDVQGDNLINFAVNEKTVASLSGVDNSGQLLADGGRAIMTAAVATDLQTAVVNNSGIVRANTAVERNGEIILSADGGNTQVSGTLDASGTGAGQKGGSIQVLGDSVALTGNAVIDASGNAGGGKINIGGNYQGNGSLKNAQNTSIGQNVKIKADATNNGNGGDVVVWANGKTQFDGTISAQGGAQGGDGGNVEVSGKQTLAFNGNVSTLAAKGKTGNLLLDPTNISVVTSLSSTPPTDTSEMTVGSLETQLNANNVTLQTASTGSNSGTITIDDGSGGGVQWSDHSLTLIAADKIFIKSNVQGSGANSSIILKAANGAIETRGVNMAANSLLIEGGGDWDLAGVNGNTTIGSYNNFNVFAANINGGLLRFSNNNSFTVGTVKNENGVDVNGITHTNGDTQLYADKNNGSITLAQGINSGNVFIRAAGGTNQTNGAITAGSLSVAGGAASLNNTNNNIGTISANINGNFSYATNKTLTVGSAYSVNGITTNNHDVTITTGNSTGYDATKQPDATNPASLVLNESINAGTAGNVRLTTGNGGVYQRHDVSGQTALTNGSITANNLLLKSASSTNVTPFVLVNSNNRVNNLAASVNGSVSFAGAGNSNSTMTIGSVSDGNTTISGITTTSNTVVSTSTSTDIDGNTITTNVTNDNNISLSIGGNLNINQNLNANAATGTNSVSIGIGGDFTAQTANGVRVNADTMALSGDDLKGTFKITSKVSNLVAAGGKLMVIDNTAQTGALAGLGIGATSSSTTVTNSGTTTTVNSSNKPVGDFYLTTGGALNILKLNSKGQNLMLRSTSLSILLDAVTADNARIMLQPLNLNSSIGIANGTEPGFTPGYSVDADTLLKFTNPVATFYFGTPQKAILNDSNVSSAAKNTFTGDVHIGYEGDFNLGYRSLSAETSGNMTAYNVGPLYNLSLAAPNLTINGFKTIGNQMQFFSNNLSLPSAASAYVNANKPTITLRSLNDQTIWLGHSYVNNEVQILPSTLVKLPDGSTIVVGGSTDYPFPNGGAGYGDIHATWDDGIVLLGNRKLILSTNHKIYEYNATPLHTNDNTGKAGGLWQGCQNLTNCVGTNPSPYPDPGTGTGGGGGGGGGGGDDIPQDPGPSCKDCPSAPPNTNPYPPDTTGTTPGDGDPNPGANPNPGTPGDGTPGDGLPGDKNPTEGIPGDGIPGDGLPGDDGGLPGGGGPGDGTPTDGNPGDGIPGDGIPGDGLPGDDGGIPGGGGPGDGTPTDGNPGDGIPGDGIPGDGLPGDNGGLPGGGGPGDGNPVDGNPGDGVPGDGIPGDGLPGDDGGLPGGGGPGDGNPGSGNPGDGNGDGSGGGTGNDNGTPGDGNGDGGGGSGNGGIGDGNGDGGNGNGSGGTGDGGGDGGAGSGNGGIGDGNGDGGNGNGSGGTGDGNGDGGAGSGNGGTGDGTGDGNGDGGSGNGSGGTGDGSGDGGGGSGNGGIGDGNGDGGSGDGSGGTGDGTGDNGSGTGNGGIGDGTGDGGSGDGSGGAGDGNGDAGAGSGNGGNGDGIGDNGNGNGSGGAGDGNGDAGAGSGNGGNGDGNGNGGNGGNGNGDSSDPSGKDDGQSDSAASVPAFDISCEDAAEMAKRKEKTDQNDKKKLVDVKQSGVKLRDPCQQPQQGDKRK